MTVERLQGSSKREWAHPAEGVANPRCDRVMGVDPNVSAPPATPAHPYGIKALAHKQRAHPSAALQPLRLHPELRQDLRRTGTRSVLGDA